MKKQLKKPFYFLKRNFGTIIIGVFILIIPIIIHLIYKNLNPDSIILPAVNVLQYCAATIGVFTSSVTVYSKYEKAKKNNFYKYMPSVKVTVDKIDNQNDNNVYSLKLYNYSKYTMKHIFVYDTKLAYEIKPEKSLELKLAIGNNSIISDKSNIVRYEEAGLLKKDDYPKYILISCEIKKEMFWNLEFTLKKKNNKEFYIMTKCELE